MSEYLVLHHALNITDKRAEEITADVLATLRKAGLVDVGIKELGQHYDAESLMAGMQLYQLTTLNTAAYENMQRKSLCVSQHPELS